MKIVYNKSIIETKNFANNIESSSYSVYTLSIIKLYQILIEKLKNNKMHSKWLKNPLGEGIGPNSCCCMNWWIKNNRIAKKFYQCLELKKSPKKIQEYLLL